jgi:short-subunit dehydrogenase
MKNYFNGAVVVITGGASGIGESLATQLGQAGARVIIVDRNANNGNKQAAFMVQNGLDGIFKKADMANVNDAKIVFASIVKEYGQIDYVFNGAGIFMAGEIRDTPIENWHVMFENNTSAIMNGSYFAYQIMLRQGSGHIINFASAAGLFPVPAMSIYGASKFAIVGLSHGLRNEAKSLGIKVSVVCPTIVNTPIYDTAIYNKVDKKKALKSRSTVQNKDVAASKILRGVIKNKATIHTAIPTRLAWYVYRFNPEFYNILARRAHAVYRKTLRM